MPPGQEVVRNQHLALESETLESETLESETQESDTQESDTQAEGNQKSYPKRAIQNCWRFYKMSDAFSFNIWPRGKRRLMAIVLCAAGIERGAFRFSVPICEIIWQVIRGFCQMGGANALYRGAGAALDRRAALVVVAGHYKLSGSSVTPFSQAAYHGYCVLNRL